LSEPEREPEREPEHEYGADEITVLEGLEAVRKRPGMYIGATSQRGLHHLVYEVLDNSVDEALAGYCDQITTTLLPDGSISVRDNGRGIPTDRIDEYDMSAVTVVLTMLHAGGKFGDGGYKVSGGLHGVGVSVVNALSEWLTVEVRRDGFLWTQSFARGEPTTELVQGEPTTELGTTVTFKPDADIFETTEVDFEVIETREREMAFLTRGLRLTLIDQRTEDRVVEFYAENGLADYVRHINKNRTPTHKTQIAFERETEDGAVEIAMQWNDSYQASVHSFANNINTHEGGTHLTGFRSALTRTVNAYARATGLIKEKDEPLGQDDAHEGLVAIISVKLQDPQFEGQTKTKLGNSPIRSLVETTTNAALAEWFEEHPAEARAIINKALQAARARQAARKARDLVRRKTALENSRLPGKLKDCSNNDPAQCELFLVEGNSAGGTAGDARDREFQAILPLRGKILNVEKARINKILSNVEIQAMITTINTGIGEEFNLDGLRYHKIVAMTDADVDGAHIRTLILTFFFRHMLPMIEAGHVYIAQPPLYRLKFGRREPLYLQNDSELERILLRERLGDIEVADRYGESPRFTEVRYQRFLGALREYEGWAARLRSEFGGSAVDYIKDHRLIEEPAATLDELESYFRTGVPDDEPDSVEVVARHDDADDPSLLLKVTEKRTGAVETVPLPQNLFASRAYDGLRKAHLRLRELAGHPPYTVTLGKKARESHTFEALRTAILDVAKEGLSLQRFKGLGEMNADQLRETTMDPATRMLRRVTIEDGQAADELFVRLMGDDVEPRRDFIQQHARDVKFLDV
jgi:DNA gyrase subunit B